MPKEREEHEDRKERKRGKPFWTIERAFVIFIFILGLLIGGFLMHQYVEPVLNENACNDYNSLVAINQQLDEQADRYYSCLLENRIDPKGC